MNAIRTLIAALGMGIVLPMAGCYAYDEPGAIGVEAYTPDYYQGNIVYFDNDEPYYFVGDEVVYVPRDRPEYARFHNHYIRYGAGYRRWYLSHPPRRPLRGFRGERREERREQWNDRRHNRWRD